MTLPMTRTIQWTDGSNWTVDVPTFGRVTDRLVAVQAMIWGLEPIVARWSAASAREQIAVDDIAPSEADRAVLTAGLERALEETRGLKPSDLGLESPTAMGDFVGALERLHQLFATDVTFAHPRKRRR